MKKYEKRKESKETSTSLKSPTFEEFVNMFLKEYGLSIEFLKLDFENTLSYLISIGKSFRDKFDACRYKLDLVCKMLSTYLSKYRLIKDVVFEPVITSDFVQIIAKFKSYESGIEIPLLMHECTDCQVIYSNVSELERFVEDVVNERVKVTKELGLIY